MISRKLFVGENAVDSILALSSNVDRQFLKKSKSLINHSILTYEPWMAMASERLEYANSATWPRDLINSPSECQLIENIILTPGAEAQLPSQEGYPIRIAKLSEKEHDLFVKRTIEARSNLIDQVPWIAPVLSSLIHNIVPVENTEGDETIDYGMSTIWLRGVVFFEKRQFRSLNFRMENLAHELAHQIMMNYQLSDLLVAEDLNTKIYSAIRNIDRPAILTLHGAAALSYMLIVSKSLGDQERISKNREDLERTLKALSSVKLTSVGNILVKEMYETL